MIKFFLIPIFTWQDELVAQIGLLEKKQNKIEQVLANNKSNVQINKALADELEKTKPLFASFESETNFKLNQQKLIERLLAKHKISLQNIGWQALTELVEQSVVRYPLKLTIKGESIDIINFMTEIESHLQLIEIADFNFSLKGQQDESLGRTIGYMTLNVFADNSGLSQ
jgi:Tfp pilus assembly protein PilO